MVKIRKDPEEIPAEVVNFSEIFSDINSPEIWISKSEEDMKPALIVLDGHSTVVIYQKETEELHWEAFNEMGNYEYSPDNIGDGMVTFPHTFYFEFKITLNDKELDVHANFDGSGIRAIVMPFKDVDVNDFISSLQDRFSDIFSTTLRPADDQFDVTEGGNIELPSSVADQLSLKLAFMGVSLERVTVKKITALEIKEGQMVEKIYDAPPEKKPEEMEEVKEPTKKRTVTASSGAGGGESVPASTPAAPPSPGKKVTSGPPGPGVKAPPGPPPTSKQVTTGPPGPGEQVDAGPPSPGKKAPPGPPSPGKKVETGPPGPKTPPGPASRSAAEELPTPAPAEVEEISSVMEEIDEAKEERELESSLLPKEMAKTTETLSLKHTHAKWYNRMVPAKTYPLTVTISTEQIQARRSSTNVMTGERKTEATSSMVVEEATLVTVRPEFPGCMVVPPYRNVDMRKDTVEANFHITPLALGSMDAKVIFEQNSKVIHHMELESKVIKHRVTQWSAALGATAAILPVIIGFFFGKTPNEFINDNLAAIELSLFLGWGYLFPVLIAGISAGIGTLAWILQKPSTNDRSVSFSQ
ncbi:MAG: hypothetical protein ACXAE3_08445 [Candidatus Kariarchaeaceae archaeon]